MSAPPRRSRKPGLQGKVAVVTHGGGQQQAGCDNIANGNFTSYVKWDVRGQARDLNDTIKILLQTKPKPGSSPFALYTPLEILTKDNLRPNSCWTLDEIKARRLIARTTASRSDDRDAAFLEETRMSMSEAYVRWRYRLIPDHIVGELLSKDWIDNAIPVLMLVIVVAFFGTQLPGLFRSPQPRRYRPPARRVSVSSARHDGRVACRRHRSQRRLELCAYAISSPSRWSTTSSCRYPGRVPGRDLVGAAVGLINGVLVGYLRLRAFLTTLVTLIFVRAIVDLLTLKYAIKVSTSTADTPVWDFIGDGTVAGVPIDLLAALVVAAIGHVFLTRMRFGWHLFAVGGSRRSAHNVGISVRRTVCLTYVISGALTACGAIFYASRLNNAGGETGVGLEIAIVTAAVLGGNSLGGGRGSVVKALLGTIIVLLVTNSLIRLGLKSGAGAMVLRPHSAARRRNRRPLAEEPAQSVSTRPTSRRHISRCPPCPSTQSDSGSPYAQNNKLSAAHGIGVGSSMVPRTLFSTMTTIFIAAAGMATSFGSFRRITLGTKSTCISAGTR